MSLVMTDRQTSIQDFNETASSPNEDDEGINNEHEIGNEEEIGNVYNAQNDEENDEEEEEDEPDNLTPDSPAPNPPVLQNVVHTTDFGFHSLLEDDISDVFNYTSETGQPGVSYKQDLTDPSMIVVTFNFHTNFIETETACQWQICNKRPLTCQLSIDCAHYLNEKVNVLHVCQICDCHPANKSKVSFIERLARDFVEKAPRNMETLKLTRAALQPELRLKYFLETLTDEFKRKQYTEMLSETQDETLLNEVLDNEILDSREKTAAKLSLLKPPRQKSSDKIIHYDLKQLPTLHHGYLVQFYKYMEYRLKNLNSLCVMCGKRTFESNDKKASKPAICDDYECFSNAMDSKFRNDPLPPSIFSIEIADFLLLLVDAAIKSPRHELILDPYPRLINPYNTSTTLLDENGNKEENLKMLEEIMNRLREMGSITQYEVARISLRGMIELKHLWAFPFFHWLMGTNRYHFSFIPREHHIKSVSTNFQYFIKHEDIVKHVKFKQMRAEKGSIFAFHGSPQENWHAILRSGLQIGRGGYLINGAAYGAGIYVSPSFEFSAGYTRNYRSHSYGASEHNLDENDKKSPLDNRKWSCMALCEIINSSDVYKKHTNDIWTIQDPDYICTRFIFFFPRGVSHNYYRVDSENEADLIRKLIHTLNNIAL